MTGERAWTAPEMTPAVDAPDEHEIVDDRRGIATGAPATPPEAGEVPGIGGRVEGRSQLGDTTETERVDDGDALDADRLPDSARRPGGVPPP